MNKQNDDELIRSASFTSPFGYAIPEINIKPDTSNEINIQPLIDTIIQEAKEEITDHVNKEIDRFKLATETKPKEVNKFDFTMLRDITVNAVNAISMPDLAQAGFLLGQIATICQIEIKKEEENQ